MTFLIIFTIINTLLTFYGSTHKKNPEREEYIDL